MDPNSNRLVRKRSTSTLANTISFTHTRTANDDPAEYQTLRSPVTSIWPGGNPLQSSRSSMTSAPPYAYLTRNGSSSTVNSLTQTLSNVGFTPVLTQSEMEPPSPSNYTGHSPASSPVLGQRKEGKLARAKLFARTKTKEALRGGKDEGSGSFLKHGHHGLSSSASNSKVVDSGNAFYSFDPAHNVMEREGYISNNAYRAQLSQEDKEHLADHAWQQLTAVLTPLFTETANTGLKLRLPIEDVNKMVTMWLQLRIESGVGAPTLIREFIEFLKHKLHLLQSSLPLDQGYFPRLALMWDRFFKVSYHYLLAVFQPLDDELNGSGPLTQKNSSYRGYWKDTVGLSVKKLTLATFRDTVVLPVIEMNPILPPVDEKERRSLVQCLGMIKTLRSSSSNSSAYAQRLVEQVSAVLEQQIVT